MSYRYQDSKVEYDKGSSINDITFLGVRGKGFATMILVVIKSSLMGEEVSKNEINCVTPCIDGP